MRGKVRPVSIRKNQEVSASKPKKQSFSAPKGTKETPKPNMGRRVHTARPNTDRKEQGPVKKFHPEHTFHKVQPQKDFVNRRPKVAAVQPAAPAPEGVIGGRNAVTELLRTGRSINKLYLQEGIQGGSIGNILRLAKQAGVALEYVKQEKLNTMLPGIKHQGVIAIASPVAFSSLESVIAKARSRGEEPFLLLLDELQDPQNVGALLRTADAAGVHGVLLPSRNSCPLNAVVAKISAGAVEYVPVVQIGNITQTLQELKKQGFWVVGADMAGSICYDTDLTGPLVVVIGAEGKGLGRLVRDNCDILVQLPMFGNINSLNASAAGAVLMYEVVRQRLARAKHNG
jgi:23S rRNA (guanosine2251-2'-O)-methyltransferase